MAGPAEIALIGDYSPNVIAHQAIPRALELACAESGADVTGQWVLTRDLRDPPRNLAGFAAVWVVPASPYANEAGVLAAIRFARESGRPCLGTCGGFQHMILEFARDVAGLAFAGHAETQPNAAALVITPLACSLVEKTGGVRFVPGSVLRQAYGGESAIEGYHCNYGLNADHRPQLESAGLRFTAFDGAGNVRGAELPPGVHPFFVGTLFQPERAALQQRTPPLVRAFVCAAAEFAARHGTASASRLQE